MNPGKLADRKKVLEIVDRYGQEDQDGWKYEVPKGVKVEEIRKELESGTASEAVAEWTKEEEEELNGLLDKVSEDELWKMLSEEDQRRFLEFAKMSGGV